MKVVKIRFQADGEEFIPGQQVSVGLADAFPEYIKDVVVGQEPLPEQVKEDIVDLDINNDGKVDKKDFSAMARALGKRAGGKRKSSRKKK